MERNRHARSLVTVLVSSGCLLTHGAPKGADQVSGMALVRRPLGPLAFFVSCHAVDDLVSSASCLVSGFIRKGYVKRGRLPPAQLLGSYFVLIFDARGKGGEEWMWGNSS